MRILSRFPRGIANFILAYFNINMAADRVKNLHPPKEGTGEGKLSLPEYMNKMNDWMRIKGYLEVLTAPEDQDYNDYTADQRRKDNEAAYYLKDTLSPVFQSMVQPLHHAADIWRRLSQVCLVLYGKTILVQTCNAML
jgi:hypothetical protein